MPKAVFCIATSESQAQDIVNQLKGAGFPSQDISVLFPDRSGNRDFVHEQHSKGPEGTVAGVSTGGIAGAAVGWMVAVGALAIPGVGPFIAAGPIMAALAGAAAGAALGGVVGALIGMGIPEYEAKRYAGKIKDGNILLSVHTESSAEVEIVKEIFRTAGAEDVTATGETAVAPGGATASNADAQPKTSSTSERRKAQNKTTEIRVTPRLRSNH